MQDEKLVAAIFATSRSHPDASPDSTPAESANTSQATTDSGDGQLSRMVSGTNAEDLENEVAVEATEEGPRLYGAQQHNMIVDARPTVNAFAMQAVGMGSENMENYPNTTKAYLGIENIHVMRDSLSKVIDALKESDFTSLPPSRELLQKSGWLKHIANMLDGVDLIARQVGVHHSHVLIHCSDGWDRTSQLSALSQLCLDPYYRTIRGFIVLVEKDFVSFGHMFRHRSGPLGSEKWFEIENERVGGNRAVSGEAGSPFGARGDAAKTAIEDGLARVKGFFNKKHQSHESLRPAGGTADKEAEDELQPFDAPPSTRVARNATTAAAENSTADATPVTKPKETAPIFHQFLDATYQLLHQHPTRFEFNERFLRRLLYHLYASQYGTFLYDSEKQRLDAKVTERTRSVWDYFLAREAQFRNERYDADIDDNVRNRERLLFPNTKKVRWWHELFGRTDEEMNGPVWSNADAEMVNGSQGSADTLATSEGALGEGVSIGGSTVLDDDGPKEGDARLSEGVQQVAAGLAKMGVGVDAEVKGSSYEGQSSVSRGIEVEMQ